MKLLYTHILIRLIIVVHVLILTDLNFSPFALKRENKHVYKPTLHLIGPPEVAFIFLNGKVKDVKRNMCEGRASLIPDLW